MQPIGLNLFQYLQVSAALNNMGTLHYSKSLERSTINLFTLLLGSGLLCRCKIPIQFELSVFSPNSKVLEQFNYPACFQLTIPMFVRIIIIIIIIISWLYSIQSH